MSRRRSFARGAGVRVAVLMLTGTTAAAGVGPARTADRAAKVPWRLAGPGWSVAEYSAASLSGAAKAKTAFELVSPKGRRHVFYVTPTATAYPKLALLDWSGDRRRILVYRDTGGSGQPTVVEQISLVSGTVVSRFKLPASLPPDEYTRPRGASILAEGDSKPGIYRYSLAGRLQQVLARRTLLGILHVLDSPSGTFLLAGTGTGVLRISNTGSIAARIHIPGSELCGPARWWTTTTALVDCFGTSPYSTERLWLVPSRGAARQGP